MYVPVLYLYIYPPSCTEHHHLPCLQLRTSSNEMPSWRMNIPVASSSSHIPPRASRPRTFRTYSAWLPPYSDHYRLSLYVYLSSYTGTSLLVVVVYPLSLRFKVIVSSTFRFAARLYHSNSDAFFFVTRLLLTSDPFLSPHRTYCPFLPIAAADPCCTVQYCTVHCIPTVLGYLLIAKPWHNAI